VDKWGSEAYEVLGVQGRLSSSMFYQVIPRRSMVHVVVVVVVAGGVAEEVMGAIR
jgi:hypothetical protein